MKYKKAFVLIFISILFSCSDDNLADKEELHLQKNKEYLLSHNYEFAEIEIKNAIKINPKNPESRWLHAKGLFGVSNYNYAIKEMRLAVNLCQNGNELLDISSCGITTDFSQLLTQSLYYIGDFDEILALKAYDNKPATNATLYAMKTLASIQKSELIKSKIFLQQALDFDPTSTLAQVAQAQYIFVTDQEANLKAKEILHQVLIEEPTNELAWGILADFENDQGHIDEAINALSKVIELNPNQFNSRFLRSLALVKLSRFEEAQKDVTFILKANTSDPRGNFIQGLIFFTEKKYELAQPALELSLPIKASYPIIHFYLGIVNNSLDHIEQAYNHASKFYIQNPENVSAVKLLALVQLKEGQFEEAENLLSTKTDEATEDVGLLTLLFDSLVKQGKTDQASVLSLKLQKIEPNNSKNQLKLGAGLFSTGDIDKGVMLLEESLIATPPNYQIIEVLVENYLQNNEIEKATKILETHNLGGINLASSHYLNGKILLAKKDDLAAEKEFTIAAELKQGYPEVNYQLAQLAINSKDYAAARKYLLTILESNKNHLPTLLKVASLEALEKNEIAMRSTLELAIKAHPKSIEPRLILSRYYLVKGQAEKVLNLLRPIANEDRERPDVLLEFGLADIAQGNYSGASYTLEKLIQKNDNNPVNYFSLANAYIGLEQHSKAMTMLDKALAIDDSFLPARLKKTQLFIHSKNQMQAEKEIRYLQSQLAGDARVLSLEAALANLKGDLGKVLTISEQLYRIEPIQQNMLKLVRARVQKGKQEQAISLLLNWLQDHDKDTLSRKVLAELYHRTDQESKADEQYKLIFD